jgi:hypothetical protein
VYNSFLSAKTNETLFSQQKLRSIAHTCETAEAVLWLYTRDEMEHIYAFRITIWR